MNIEALMRRVMSPEKFSSFLSLLVALAVLLANFFQWYDLTYWGKLRLKRWALGLLVICVLVLVASICLLFAF